MSEVKIKTCGKCIYSFKCEDSWLLRNGMSHISVKEIKEHVEKVNNCEIFTPNWFWRAILKSKEEGKK